MKEQFISIYFKNQLEKLLKLDQQNKKRKYRHTKLAKNDYEITAAWQIDN